MNLAVRHRPITCQHCEGASGHPPIDGEGVAVCVPCVYRLGRHVNESAEAQEKIDQAAINRRLAAMGISYPDEDCVA